VGDGTGSTARRPSIPFVFRRNKTAELAVRVNVLWRKRFV
jgi:hypothetical protein